VLLLVLLTYEIGGLGYAILGRNVGISPLLIEVDTKLLMN
jgi:hypothetical protein